MDKVNKILAVLKKYHFWVACGAVVLVSIVCWWLASMGLASKFQQRKGTIEGEFKAVVIAPNPPNNDLITNIDKQRKLLQDNVLRAWETLYEEQKQKNPCPKELSREFKEAFERLESDPKRELDWSLREDYRTFIPLHLPWLRELVDARRLPAAKKSAAGGEGGPAADRRAAPAAADAAGPLGANGELPPVQGRRPAVLVRRLLGAPAGRTAAAEEDLIGVVDWNDANVAALAARFDWRDTTPSTLKVVLAQEDLWVIEALLRVIADTNEGCTYSTAAVKRIDYLQIGKDAAGQGDEARLEARRWG